MRRLTKIQEPQVLVDNRTDWTTACATPPLTDAKKYRYRHRDIKARLAEETSEKCIYCEQKVAPVAPSHVEHKTPVSVDASKRFDWANLTLACPECNRRKNAFYSNHIGFLDPYDDDVEYALIHRGPIVTWRPGESRAELSVRYLALDGSERNELVRKKIDFLSKLDNAVERYVSSKGTELEPLLRKQLKSWGSIEAEFSGMVRSMFSLAGLDELL